MKANKKGLLLVLSGPSGVGKGTVCRALLQKEPSLRLSVSATTRSPRPEEIDGVDYFFLDHTVFHKMIEDGALLEYAQVYNNYYGTPLPFVEECLKEGHDIILEIDIQGALQIKGKYPRAVLIFIAPPTKFDLKKRLFLRGSDERGVIEKRLHCTADEMKMAVRYDYIVVNDQVNRAAEKIRSIIVAEKSRPHNFKSLLGSFN